MTKIKRTTAFALIILVITTATLLIHNRTKLTYLEYQYENESVDGSVEINTNSNVIEQVFVSPYDILGGVSVKVGTFDKDNNSIWNIAILNASDKKELYSKDYTAGDLVNNEFYLFRFKKNIKVNKSEELILRITPKLVNENTGLSFFYGNKVDASPLFINGEDGFGTLCFAIYGGDSDLWWNGFIIILAVIMAIAIIRGYVVCSKGLKLNNDRFFGALAIFFVVLLLLGSFSFADGFTDEYDNIRGGMIISKGGVLYRDYVTQHTPVMYYLCGVFALLGAGSLQQFRLSFYFFEAVVWGTLYFRHEQKVGKKKLLLVVVTECVFITSVLAHVEGYSIFSECMQGLCLVALLLEFIGFCEDRSIKWDRAAIISASVLGSFGAAFVSAYAIVFVVLAVVALEIYWSKKDSNVNIHDIVVKYTRLLVSIAIPLFIAVVYFWLNGALITAVRQFYLFNREVYINYGYLGERFIDPFITSISSFFGIFADKAISVVNATATVADILQLFIISMAVACLVVLCMNKQYFTSFTIGAVMIFSATRGYGYHGLSAWYIAVFIMALYGDLLLQSITRKVSIPVCFIVAVILLSVYIGEVETNLFAKQGPVGTTESRVVALTEKNEKILIDAYHYDSIYLLYKDRYPANRACYFLPWYMDWFEQDVIDDLHNNEPRIVVYNPDCKYASFEHYANAFAVELEKDYVQLSSNPDDGWMYNVWMRK